jgi:hypothetical protein
MERMLLGIHKKTGQEGKNMDDNLLELTTPPLKEEAVRK